MKKISLIGSTGSIGRQTCSVVRRYPEKFKIEAMAAGSNAELKTGAKKKDKFIVN